MSKFHVFALLTQILIKPATAVKHGAAHGEDARSSRALHFDLSA